MVFAYISFINVTKIHVTKLAAVIASNSSSALAFDSAKDGTDTLSALVEEKHIVAASLYKSDGKIFAKHPVYFELLIKEKTL